MNANMRIYLVGVAWPSSRGLRATILNIHAIGNDVLYIFNVGVSQIQLWSARGKTGQGGGVTGPPPPPPTSTVVYQNKGCVNLHPEFI